MISNWHQLKISNLNLSCIEKLTSGTSSIQFKILTHHLTVQLQFMQHFQQKFLPDIFSKAWIYNIVRKIGENSIVLRNMDQLCAPFARISLVEKVPLVSVPPPTADLIARCHSLPPPPPLSNYCTFPEAAEDLCDSPLDGSRVEN